jgi:hypothetical protein
MTHSRRNLFNGSVNLTAVRTAAVGASQRNRTTAVHYAVHRIGTELHDDPSVIHRGNRFFSAPGRRIIGEAGQDEENAVRALLSVNMIYYVVPCSLELHFLAL